MRIRHTSRLVIVVVSVLVVCSSARAVRVGWTCDVHQGKNFMQVIDPSTGQLFTTSSANDFHVWGVVEDTGAAAPTVAGSANWQTNGPPNYAAIPAGLSFPTFTSTMGGTPTRPLPAAYPGPPTPAWPYYYFDANWSGATIPLCTWMHFGLSFNVTGANYMYWLSSVWTKNGVDPTGQPVYGFYVDDGFTTSQPQKINIQNASGVDTEVSSMQMMVLTKEEGDAFDMDNLSTEFFDSNPAWDARWVDVPTAQLPTGSFDGDGSNFDILLQDVPGLGTMGPYEYLMARQYSEYEVASTDYFWQYEFHGAIPEPGTFMLLAVGAGFLLRRRRKA